ncbi:signal peptidase I [Sporosarcina sp. Marseille-Q4063]|uniref:signal peptidase I n=1 Tax=Sporosarcina sp. Marseille-Q4063 TaxID=2810514 RepID=UPI001BB0C083|nr:signal peptidase I [Sporosarcina sp. Marseille-Q4063]QUW23206.1 signal peptidase I [Sporosarcina sp. Marseille-Q4063]
MSEAGKKELFSWVKSAGIALILVILIRQFLFTPVIVSGESMEPTFENDNMIVISKIHSIDRFDMVVFHSPYADDNLIKRVIGLPGDHVVMDKDNLYINDQKHQEDYLAAHKEKVFIGERLTEDFEVVVPKGKIFVLGDNRRFSKDSRELGFIDEKLIVGKVAFRFYPITDIGIPK